MNKLVYCLILTLAGCAPAVDYSPPPAIVYMTRGDYSDKVPVMMSEDRKTILSFPDLADLRRDSLKSLPVQLVNGYLLDNRGIGPQVAFLRLNYDEYAGLKQPPTPDQLISNLLDTDPIVEMYNCGNRNAYKNIKNDL